MDPLRTLKCALLQDGAESVPFRFRFTPMRVREDREGRDANVLKSLEQPATFESMIIYFLIPAKNMRSVGSDPKTQTFGPTRAWLWPAFEALFFFSFAPGALLRKYGASDLTSPAKVLKCNTPRSSTQ